MTFGFRPFQSFFDQFLFQLLFFLNRVLQPLQRAADDHDAYPTQEDQVGGNRDPGAQVIFGDQRDREKL